MRPGRATSVPRLTSLDTQIFGAGATVSVRFTKKPGEGTPVRFIAADDPTEAAAVREVDLQKRFHLSATQLANRLQLTTNKSHALWQRLGVDRDPQCMHTFMFGKSTHAMFSDNALTRMREALAVGNEPSATAV